MSSLCRWEVREFWWWRFRIRDPAAKLRFTNACKGLNQSWLVLICRLSRDAARANVRRRRAPVLGRNHLSCKGEYAARASRSSNVVQSRHTWDDIQHLGHHLDWSDLSVAAGATTSSFLAFQLLLHSEASRLSLQGLGYTVNKWYENCCLSPLVLGLSPSRSHRLLCLPLLNPGQAVVNEACRVVIGKQLLFGFWELSMLLSFICYDCFSTTEDGIDRATFCSDRMVRFEVDLLDDYDFPARTITENIWKEEKRENWPNRKVTKRPAGIRTGDLLFVISHASLSFIYLRWLGTVVTSHAASHRQAYTPVMSMVQKAVQSTHCTFAQSTSRHTNVIMLYAVKCSLYVVGQC